MEGLCVEVSSRLERRGSANSFTSFNCDVAKTYKAQLWQGWGVHEAKSKGNHAQDVTRITHRMSDISRAGYADTCGVLTTKKAH